MPLYAVALPATADGVGVRFAMKDGCKTITVVVANPALEEIDSPSEGTCFEQFKVYRKAFERLASAKYDRGHVEEDGAVYIRALDLPAYSSV